MGPTTLLQQRQAQDAPVAEDFVQLFVAHLGEGRVHHHDQSDRDRDRSCSDAEAVQQRHGSRDEPAQQNAEGHRGEDPAGEVSIEEAETARGLHS